MVHLSHYTKGLILLGVINLLIVLLIFLSPQPKLFSDDNEITLFSNENVITGMAVSGFTEATESTPAIREILISPKTGKVSSEGTFTVDVLANPALGSVNAKYYKINLRFDSTKLTYNTNSVKSLKQGWVLTESLTGTITKTLSIEGTTTGSGLSSGLASLFEVGFTAEKVAQDTSVSILILLAGFKESKTSTTISSAITKKTSSTITITAPVIIDNDGDGYSPPEDCDDDKTDDNDQMMQCPTSVSGCYEYIYQSGATDIVVVSQKHKYCAICKNPSIPLDYCDGIDNDCDGVVDGKTTIYENCPSGACSSSSATCTLEVCDNNKDDDGDGNIDSQDTDCIGKKGACTLSNDVIVWSYTPDEDKTKPPQYIGCCEAEQCAGIYNSNKVCYDFEDMMLDNSAFICSRHNDWLKCTSSEEGHASDGGKYICSKSKWVVLSEYFDTETICTTCTQTPTQTHLTGTSLVFTPACGGDGDNDGNLCDTFENYLTCPNDCIKEDICNSAKPNGNANYCLIDTNNDGAYDNDLDGDGLSNEYEVYLEVNVPQEIKQDSQQMYKGWYDMNNPDTDGDGVFDNKDYCPGTDTKYDKLTLATGHINFNGCYVGDVGQQKKDILNPDGCFSQADTKFLISYYKSIVKGESCLNLYGQDIKK